MTAGLAPGLLVDSSLTQVPDFENQLIILCELLFGFTSWIAAEISWPPWNAANQFAFDVLLQTPLQVDLPVKHWVSCLNKLIIEFNFIYFGSELDFNSIFFPVTLIAWSLLSVELVKHFQM